MKPKRCWYCGEPLNAKNKKRKPTKDHQTPTSRGGKNNDENKVWACIECNQDKGNLTLEEYRVVISWRDKLLIINTKTLKRFAGENVSV